MIPMPRILLCLTSLLCAAFALAQTPAHSIRESSAKQHSFFTNRSEWTEVLDSRDEHHASWKHADGRIMIENSKKPIHFKKENRWERIDARCTPYAGGWQAMHQHHPVRIENDASFKTDYTQASEMHIGSTCRINDVTLELHCSETANNTFFASTQLPWITKEITASENGVKYNYVLSQATEGLGEFTVFSETIEFNSTVSVLTLPNEGRMENNRWIGPVHFIDEQKNHVGSILPALCFDALETWERESNRIVAGYSWIMENNRIVLQLHVPNNWLRASERAYPVTIDPLVVGPTAAFGDNVMLSCYIPDYNVDSLLVTIPAQVTVTGCFVTASYWAEPLAGAIMMDGSMFFSTTCDSSGTFEVAPPTGLQAGTAYLELFDFRDPLLCCFAPSCSERSFYFRMHLGRYTPEGDCNYAYIFYNPTTTLWPFTAYIEGRTVETYGLEFTVPGTPICSSQCTFEGKVRTKYGVPPYTISHPWMAADSIVAQSSPCDLSGIVTNLYMQWPGCPEFCPDPFAIDVPAPTVVDACGNVVSGLANETLNIKAAPSIEDPSPVMVCSNIPTDITIQSCAPDYTLSWSGNGISGTGNTIPILLSNTDTTINTVLYRVNTVWNNCPSDTLNLLVDVMPSPIAAFNIAPNPAMQGVPAFFIDQTTISVGNSLAWNWTLDGGQPQSGDINSYIIPDLGYHTVCLEVYSDAGCPDTLCKDFEVVTPSLDAPNVFTPNGDGTNATLVFDQLQFYPSSHLYVYNRWGNLVYEQENYQNNWDGDDLPEGVYYYVLDVEFYGSIASYLHILR
jgi:gliding motility-associated-like protein